MCNKSHEIVSNMDYLRGLLWMKGEGLEGGLGRQIYESSQNFARNAWKGVCEKIDAGSTQLQWDQRLVDIMNASFAKVSWDDFQSSFRDQPYTIIHGDFHPANIMIHKDSKEVYIIDWEMVGVGRAAQDLGQFVISHLAPEDRRQVESLALDEYYDSLVKAAEGKIDVNTYTKEVCRQEYVAGGVARWVWLLAYIAHSCPENFTKFFHDQLLAFILDHNVTPESVDMPRV